MRAVLMRWWMTVVLAVVAASPQLAWADTVRARAQLKPSSGERTLADLRSAARGVESAPTGVQPVLPKKAGSIPAPPAQPLRQRLLQPPSAGLRAAAGFPWPVRIYARRHVLYSVDDPDDA